MPVFNDDRAWKGRFSGDPEPTWLFRDGVDARSVLAALTAGRFSDVDLPVAALAEDFTVPVRGRFRDLADDDADPWRPVTVVVRRFSAALPTLDFQMLDDLANVFRDAVMTSCATTRTECSQVFYKRKSA